MKERPILFSGEMVRAILEGRKTQTRRPVKPQPVPFGQNSPFTQATLKEHVGKPWMPVGGVFQDAWHKPLGTVGDRLWVREAFGFSRQCDDVNEQERVVVYKASEPFHVTDAGVDRLKRCDSGCLMQPNHYVGAPGKWRPSIHMPRWASRIDLEITAVRVERVQDITDFNAYQEGAKSEAGRITGPYCMSYKQGFRTVWQSIYGTWDSNPWVWMYEFRRVK